MRMMTWREMLAGVTGRGDSRVSSWVHIITAVFTPTDRPLPIAVHASGADAVDPAARRPRARLDSLSPSLSSDDDSSDDGSWPRLGAEGIDHVPRGGGQQSVRQLPVLVDHHPLPSPLQRHALIRGVLSSRSLQGVGGHVLGRHGELSAVGPDAVIP